jgi:hypothetical protein
MTNKDVREYTHIATSGNELSIAKAETLRPASQFGAVFRDGVLRPPGTPSGRIDAHAAVSIDGPVDHSGQIAVESGDCVWWAKMEVLRRSGLDGKVTKEKSDELRDNTRLKPDVTLIDWHQNSRVRDFQEAAGLRPRFVDCGGAGLPSVVELFGDPIAKSCCAWLDGLQRLLDEAKMARAGGRPGGVMMSVTFKWTSGSPRNRTFQEHTMRHMVVVDGLLCLERPKGRSYLDGQDCDIFITVSDKYGKMVLKPKKPSGGASRIDGTVSPVPSVIDAEAPNSGSPKAAVGRFLPLS